MRLFFLVNSGIFSETNKLGARNENNLLKVSCKENMPHIMVFLFSFSFFNELMSYHGVSLVICCSK